MMRSGMETTSRAFLYSGFLEKRDEASRVETSSVRVLDVKIENQTSQWGRSKCSRTGLA